jgi:hypothetical protein
MFIFQSVAFLNNAHRIATIFQLSYLLVGFEPGLSVAETDGITSEPRHQRPVHKSI